MDLRKLIILLIFLISLQIAIARENVNYDYMIGTGFLEEFGPVISMARNGDTIELRGEGTLSTKPKTVTGGGTFIHKDKDGNIIGTGDWHAMELITFRSYGSGILQGLPEEFEGGRALIRVHLAPASGGPGFFGVLRVNCLLGKYRSKDMEGIRLLVPQAKINFNEELSGATLFVRKSE